MPYSAGFGAIPAPGPAEPEARAATHAGAAAYCTLTFRSFQDLFQSEVTILVVKTIP